MPSKLEQLQQQYRRQLLQEKEERMIKIHTDSQQKALSKIAKYNGISATFASNVQPPAPHQSPIKKGSPGVDRSHPLPPIVKEKTNTNGTRISPVSAPSDNASKVANATSRSKSVDLVDSRQSPSRGASSERNNVRNGYGKTSNGDAKFHAVEQEKKPDPETIAKLKQAELQRLRAKIREESVSRTNGYSNTASKTNGFSSTTSKTNGFSNTTSKTNSFSNTMSKSSNPQKKTTAAKIQQAPIQVSRPKPPIQSSTIAQSRKPAVPPSKTTPRHTAKSSTSSNSVPARKPPGPGQEQCRVCGRNFNADRIEKHVSICSKAAQKKVKVFDATKMRVKGTEAEQFVKKGLPKVEPKANKSDWRKKHNDFIEAIRQAKMVQQHLAKGGKVSDLPPPPPSDTSDYVPCPYCGRRFNPGVADRHIPKCKNILSNKKNPVSRRK